MRSLLLLVAVVAGAAWAAADEPKKPNYYPLAKGNKWEYEVTLTDKKKHTEVVEVAATEVKDGKLLATVKKSPNPSVISTHVYRADDSAVVELRWNDIEYGPPIPHLKFPLKKGEKWSLKRNIDGGTLERTWTVGEPVEVTVPAGKFKAVPIVYTEDVAGIKVTGTRYYADGVGLVRREAVFFLGTVTEELTKFTPGK
jgi:hypothetical protein